MPTTTNRRRIPDLPDVLTTKDGTKVTAADMWSKVRRAEIVEDFDREVLGCVPKEVPKVTWSVAATSQGTMGTTPITTKQFVGHWTTRLVRRSTWTSA